NQWYHPYTDYVIDNGLMNGMSNSKFNPNGETTRAMLVTTLYRMAGEPEVTELSTFTDVPKNQWYAKAVAWAQDLGIATGVTDTTFCPGKAVTREQAAAFLYRYVTLYLKQEPAKGADLSVYKDADKITGFAKEAIAWATAEGLFNGFENGTFQPKGTLTRAQMAKLLTVLDQKF
ncbi:MAG: S-layer homology domain-containing protein, partial [Faecousia sp.]